MDRRPRGEGARRDRDPQPQSRLQQGVRLLPRGQQREPRAGADALHPQADARRRRALHNARPQGVRGAGPRRAGGSTTWRLPSSGRSPRPSPRAATASFGRPTYSRGSTCTPRSPRSRSGTPTSRPVLSEGPEIRIVGGRHPVVELSRRDVPFVPNDVWLSSEDGPNHVSAFPVGEGRAVMSLSPLSLEDETPTAQEAAESVAESVDGYDPHPSPLPEGEGTGSRSSPTSLSLRGRGNLALR